MSNMEQEAARIREALAGWAKRVERVQAGERLPAYGFDAKGRDLGKEEKDGN